MEAEMMEVVEDVVEDAAPEILRVKQTQRAARRALSRAAAERQALLAKELGEDVKAAGHYRKHHSVDRHPYAKGRHEPTVQELSFDQPRLHADCPASNDELQAVAA